MPIGAIIRQVVDSDRPLVLVTGGEPLAQRHTIELLAQLSALDCIVQLETAGAYPVASVPAGVRRIIDIKTPGSGEVERNCLENLENLTPDDEIKFVLTGRNDYKWARDFVRHHQLGKGTATVLFSPVWDDMPASELCAWVLEDHLPVRVQVQMHKAIWGPEAEGV